MVPRAERDVKVTRNSRLQVWIDATAQVERPCRDAEALSDQCRRSSLC